MQHNAPLRRDLVLVGGGHTHALLLEKLARMPIPGTRVTVVNPEPVAYYSGMLPGYIAGHYMIEDLEIDLVKLAGRAGARLVLARASGIARETREVVLTGRPSLAYDVASINIGITTTMPDLPGFAAHAIPAKPLAEFAICWRRFLDAVVAGETEARVIVLGGGVAGLEIALAAAWRLRQANAPRQAVTVVEAGPEVLRELSPRSRRFVLAKADALGVQILRSVRPARIGKEFVELETGDRLESGLVVGIGGGMATPWFAQSGLELVNGFISVNSSLQSMRDNRIFAVGDCAHLSSSPRPKAGVFAVRQAPVLYQNLMSRLTEGRSRKFKPQKDYLKLISVGDRVAVAEKFGLSLAGRWVWNWKHAIDFRFMERFRKFHGEATRTAQPAHSADEPNDTAPVQPLCAGCGAKIGRKSLERALAPLARPGRHDAVTGLGDDAAVLETAGNLQVISVDQLRSFTTDPWRFARIATVHALGDIWAMNARPHSALLSITLPRMSQRMQVATVRELLEGCKDVLGQEGAQIVGGNTSQGAELSLAITVTGFLSSTPVGKSGAAPGDKLLLTKPLGTGTVLAASMVEATPGQILASTLSVMEQSSGEIASLLGPASHAMTDVTGFGLAGHLMDMLECSAVAARLQLDSIPILEGAEALAIKGFRSSIFAENYETSGRMTLSGDDVRMALLFDPQTAGGLLAAVAPAQLDRVLEASGAKGIAPAVIGEIVEGDPWIEVHGSAS